MIVTITVRGDQGEGKSATLGRVMVALKDAGIIPANAPVEVADPVSRKKPSKVRARFYLEGHKGDQS